jgi:hypothetical protein
LSDWVFVVDTELEVTSQKVMSQKEEATTQEFKGKEGQLTLPDSCRRLGEAKKPRVAEDLPVARL